MSCAGDKFDVLYTTTDHKTISKANTEILQDNTKDNGYDERKYLIS